jgi:hypothetical protein
MERPVMNTSLVIGTFQVYDDNSDVELFVFRESGSFVDQLSKEYSVP